jgi:sugar phosphate isomerase/epimerase
MHLTQVAAQLYTVRDHCQTSADLAATAARISAIGYTAVQVSGIGPIPDGELVRIMAGEGLTICATHEPADRILRQPEACIARLQALGCRLTAYPHPKGVNLGSREEVLGLIAALARAGARFAAAGLRLGYHNHAVEFVRFEDTTVLDAIYARTDPRHLVAELDTYWVQYGGCDPVAWCEKLRGRLPFIHLKDYGFTTANQPVFAEIGAGNLDWPRIIAAADRAGCEWFIVEQDVCAGNPFDSLRRSFEHIKARLAS